MIEPITNIIVMESDSFFGGIKPKTKVLSADSAIEIVKKLNEVIEYINKKEGGNHD